MFRHADGFEDFLEIAEKRDYTLYKKRRDWFCDRIRYVFPELTRATIIIWAAFEQEGLSFRQDSSFFYLTGVDEPGAALVLTLDSQATLYVPRYSDSRARWVSDALEPSLEKSQELCVDEIEYLGKAVSGYVIYPFGPQENYEHLIERLQKACSQGERIGALLHRKGSHYVLQSAYTSWISPFIAGKQNESFFDVSPILSHIRRTKEMDEIAALVSAAGATILGHKAAAGSIAPGMHEAEIQANAEYLMTVSTARRAFPSIIASGKNSTILHYTANNQYMQQGDLVVVDIGAEYDHYCGDITRTYPVSGKFSKRQRELYTIVLETQAYLVDILEPGFWISNKNEPEKSLYHCAKKFLKDCGGYDQYFTHGIGHFLGLDVHDVGDYDFPLMIGDVITIEPGIYIPQEGIGIRIEDDYWLSEKGLLCLSDDLPKELDEIENFMKEEAEVEDSEDDFEESDDEYGEQEYDEEEVVAPKRKKYSEITH